MRASGLQTSIKKKVGYRGYCINFSTSTAKLVKPAAGLKTCAAYQMCELAVGALSFDDAICARAVPPFGRQSGNSEFRRQRERREFRRALSSQIA